MTTTTQTLNNGQTILIREAAPDDAPEMIEYAESVSAESSFLLFGPGEFGIGLEEEIRILKGIEESDNQVFLVASVESEIVGVVNLFAAQRPRYRHVGEIGISVRKACQGLGIGSMLMQTLIDWASRNPVITKVNLKVRTDNHRAIALYKRHGFEPEGTIRKDILVNGTYYDHHLMGRETL